MYNSNYEVKKMENGVLLQGFHWYIKPEENAVYYVINNKVQGQIEF